MIWWDFWIRCLHHEKWAPGPLGSIFLKNRFFYDFLDVGQYFAYKRYFNTIIRPWDLSRIAEHGLLYVLTEYNEFWTGLARSGLDSVQVQSRFSPGLAQVRPFRAILITFWISTHGISNTCDFSSYDFCMGIASVCININISATTLLPLYIKLYRAIWSR